MEEKIIKKHISIQKNIKVDRTQEDRLFKSIYLIAER